MQLRWMGSFACLVTLTVILLAFCTAKQVKMSKSKSNRNYIIKCCGKNSCVKLAPKKINRTLITSTTGTSATFSTETISETVRNSIADGITDSLTVRESMENANSSNSDSQTQTSMVFSSDQSSTEGVSNFAATGQSLEDTQSSSNTFYSDSTSSVSSADPVNSPNWTESTSANLITVSTITDSRNSPPDPTKQSGTSTTKKITATPATKTSGTAMTTKIQSATSTTKKITATLTAIKTATTRPPISVLTTIQKTTTKQRATSTAQKLTSKQAVVVTSTTKKITATQTTTKKTTTKPVTTKKTTTRIPRPFVPFNFSSLQCAKNTSLFDGDGYLEDAQYYGSWREICGELYLFGKSIVTWRENVRRCCSIGMKPIAFETIEQFNCLDRLVKAEVWQYNYNYWTAARQALVNDVFKWALYETGSPYANLNSMWASGFPENATFGNCIQLFIPRKMNVTGLTIKNCSDTYIFSCKGKPTPPPKCFRPVCPNSDCVKNEALYVTAPDNITKYLNRPTKYGVWRSKNYRIFLFGNQSKTWNDAKETCCAIGMKLLSLDADFKYSTLSQVISGKDNASLTAKYWTSGTDNGCPAAFAWCAENKLVRNAMWAPGEPRSGNYCVVADVRTTNTTLMTALCTQSLRFICETRDTSNATSAGETIKDECAANFNVSIAEQDSIFNSTRFSRRIKCFLKCVGEAGGLMVNGRIVDGQLIKLAEILSQDNNDKLMENLKAVDECSQIKGMDECDMIASVFQCGQEKAPDLVANVIKSVELNDTAEKTPLKPKLGQCITDYKCVVSQYWRNTFLTFDNDKADGVLMDICGQRYLLGMNKASYREGASWCCLYGLNLVSFQLKKELECVINSPLGGLQRPASIWTSASRKGTTDKEGFRWCTSRTFFNFTMWKWHPKVDDYPANYLITLVAMQTFADSYFNVNFDNPGVAYPMCEQRPV